MSAWQIMFILYIVSALMNLYRLGLEDRSERPGLQRVLLIVTFITGFLSLPVTLFSFGILSLYSNRMSRICDRDINAAKIEITDAKNREIQLLEDKIRQCNSAIDEDRKRFRESVRDFQKLREISYQDGFEAGYRVGWQDHADGFNMLEE